MYSKNDICNLALSRLGSNGNIENIDQPIEEVEKTFAKWYDITRRAALRRLMPSFARTRKNWSKCDTSPDFGYKFAYKYRSDCVKILGIGNLDNPVNNYTVEGGYVLTNEEYPSGLPVRYVEDVEDVKRFDDNFIEVFSLMLAYNVCPEVTDNANTMQYLEKVIPMKIVELIGVDSQENKPIRIVRSRIGNARLGYGYGVRKA